MGCMDYKEGDLVRYIDANEIARIALYEGYINGKAIMRPVFPNDLLFTLDRGSILHRLRCGLDLECLINDYLIVNSISPRSLKPVTNYRDACVGTYCIGTNMSAEGTSVLGGKVSTDNSTSNVCDEVFATIDKDIENWLYRNLQGGRNIFSSSDFIKVEYTIKE